MATKDELKAAADEQGLTVGRRDGKPGEPTAADYQHALDVAAGAIAPDPPQATERTFTVTGPFRVLGVEPGGTFTAVVSPEGAIYDDRGRTVAVAGPLVEQGAITETKEGENG